MIRNYALVLRLVILTLLLFVLTANISLFIITQGGYTGNPFFTDGVNPFDTRTLVFAHYHYHGFRDFFNFMKTFPGLNMSLSTLNEVGSIIFGQLDYSPILLLDWLIKLVNIITLPIKLIFTFVGDIFNIFIWIGRWLIPTLIG